jgi:hypothetical protein
VIPRIRIASVGRDLGIRLYEQEATEWQEHFRERPVAEPVEAEPADGFIKDALSIFDAHMPRKE